MSSLSDSTDAVSPEHIPPAPDVPTSGDDLNELLRDGTRVAFRGSVFIDGQHYPHGEKLADLCEELDLEYKQSVTKSTCDLLVSDDPDAQDTKAELARKYDKPVITSEDFADWAQERLADAGDASVEDQPEPVAQQAEVLPGSGGLEQRNEAPETRLLRAPVVVGAVFILLALTVLVRRRKR
ncbi:hypothetical protein NYP18_05660 [Corynebacterium sp. YIM 101645]|uniref:BRCT domain-containing protein n=1 Tax=Corynebacterium lemuris TaxID=1859292 RepID=A0ABT2FV69_9CORY|nr:hypothetical protein [Corynebacterium lemuris]MCS5479136.1 hypothetical protein [Corynebacterium lemuris]